MFSKKQNLLQIPRRREKNPREHFNFPADRGDDQPPVLFLLCVAESMSSLPPLSFPSLTNIEAAQALLAQMCQDYNNEQSAPNRWQLPNGQLRPQRDLFDDKMEDSDPVVEDDDVNEYEAPPPGTGEQAALRRAVNHLVRYRLGYLAEMWQRMRTSPGASGLAFHDLLFAATFGRTFPFNTFPNPGWISTIVSEMATDLYMAYREELESL